MAHPRGFRGRSTGSRRKTSWGVGPQEVDGSASASAADLWSSGVILATEDEVTIVRIRGVIRAILGAAGAIGDGFFGAFGIGIATTAAFTAGVTSVPTPLTEEDWDGWMWHSYFDIRSVTATIADGVNAAAASVNVEIDSKAMRKFTGDMTLYGCTEVVESGTATIETQGQTRILVKLP